MKKIDFHVHIDANIPIEKTVEYFNDMCQRKGYSGVGIMAFPNESEGGSVNCNEDALAIRALMPGSYAFAGLFDDKDYVQQAKEYQKLGFDGIKMLHGKPSLYRKNGFSYNDKRFDSFFEYCEKEQIPLLIHNNDPKANWDITKATQRAIKNGWVYDETIPSQEWFFKALEEGVFEKHPNLRAAIAHFGFYSDDIDRAQMIMEKYPNIFFDITPAIDIYVQLSERHKRAEEFFRKYHDRLIYGTDAHNNLVGFSREYNDIKTDITDLFLEGDKPQTVHDRYIVPLKLEKHMLENIYYNNAIKFMNK